MPNTPFDPIKALREEIQGILNVQTTLITQTRHAEKQSAEAAAQHDALMKLEAYVKGELERKRAVLRELESKQKVPGWSDS